MKATLCTAIARSMIAIVFLASGTHARPSSLFGRYDGSCDPGTERPPEGNIRWLKVEGWKCAIQPNTPEPGQATFLDDEMQIGSYLNIKTPLDTQKHFGGKPEETEYEFSIRVAVVSAGHATLPNFQVGFRDEGGEGRCVALAWYRAADDEFLLAFMEASAAGPLIPVGYFNWMDGKMREYTVKKYRDPASGEMVLQVLIDGAPQCREPVPYASLSHDLNDSQGFQFGTSSATKGKYIVDDIRFGSLDGIPPVAEVSAIAAADGRVETGVPVRGPWRVVVPAEAPADRLIATDAGFEIRVDGSFRVASEKMPLKRNRMYRIRGKAAVQGSITLAEIAFEQYRGDYPVNTPPHQRFALALPADGAEIAFDFPVYLRQENDRFALAVSAEGQGGILQLSELVITGGGSYRPGLKVFPPEEPAFCDSDILEELAVRPAPAACVTNRLGLMALNVSGKDEAPFFHVSSIATSRNSGRWGAFGQSGVHLQSMHFSPASSPEFPEFWAGPGQYNFQSLEDILKLVLSRDKSARIILGVWTDPYKNWGLENPDEVCQNSAGLYGIGANHFSGWAKKPGNLRLLPSIFSRKMTDDIVDMMSAMENWLAGHDIGKAVVGYYIWGFNDADFGHWVHPCTSAGEKDPDDYSPAALAAWRRWLRERYEGDVARLRTAWQQPEAAFDTVALPSPERRRSRGGEGFPWLLAPEDREIVDFNRFYGETPSLFSRAIIEGVRQRTGTPRFFMLHNGNAMHGWRGYTGFGVLSRIEGLNCVSATSDYSLRWPGYPGGCDSFPETLGLQGKLFFHEFDYRTHCTPSQFESMDFVVGRSSDAAMHRAMLQREGMNMLARGHGMYVMPLGANWYGDPDLFTGIRDVVGLYRQQIELPGPAVAEAAYFLGEDSINFLGDSPEASRFLMRATRRQRPEWDTAGVPYHLYLQRDISDARLPDYKVYVFLMPQQIDPGERQAIEALKRDGKTLVFLHAPGLCGAGDPTEAIHAITGMRAAQLPGNEVPLAGTWLEAPHPLLAGLTGRFGDRPIPWAFTDRESRGLAFAIDDPDAVPLARYRDNPDAVAAAVRDFGAWRSIYVAVPWLEARFIANIAATAGAWRAAEPHDAVFANQHFIGIHGMAAGKKVLRPYRKSRVTDAFTGELIADGVTEFTVDLPFGVTRVYRTEAQE